MTSDRVGMIILLGIAVFCFWRAVQNWRRDRREAREASEANRPPDQCDWTGAVSDVFEDPRNWWAGRVPRDGDSVLVPGPTPHVLSGDIGVKLTRLSIFPGASVGVSTGEPITTIDEVCDWNDRI